MSAERRTRLRRAARRGRAQCARATPAAPGVPRRHPAPRRGPALSPEAPPPERAVGRSGHARGPARRGRRGEGGVRAAASPQKPRAAQEDGASAANPSEPVRCPRAREGGGRAGLGADAALGPWRDRVAGVPGPPRPSPLETLCRRPHLLPVALASSGRRERRGPAPSAAPPPQHAAPASLALRAPPRPLRSSADTLAPGTDPRAPSLASPSAPFPTPLLCGLATASPPLAPSRGGRRRLFASAEGFWCIGRSNLTCSNAKYSAGVFFFAVVNWCAQC